MHYGAQLYIKAHEQDKLLKNEISCTVRIFSMWVEQSQNFQRI